MNVVSCFFESGCLVVGFREPGATLGARCCFVDVGETTINQRYVNGFSNGSNAG